MKFFHSENLSRSEWLSKSDRNLNLFYPYIWRLFYFPLSFNTHIFVPFYDIYAIAIPIDFLSNPWIFCESIYTIFHGFVSSSSFSTLSLYQLLLYLKLKLFDVFHLPLLFVISQQPFTFLVNFLFHCHRRCRCRHHHHLSERPCFYQRPISFLFFITSRLLTLYTD